MLHFLIAFIETWEKCVDNAGAFAGLLTDLSKGFHWLSHKLFIAKLGTYRFDKISLILIYEYLSDGNKR